jgi:hypothetical protein
MSKSTNLPPRDSSGRFAKRLPIIPDFPHSSRDSSPANPLDSPESDTTARPDLVFPSSDAHLLPGSFPSSEDSVSFSRLVVTAAENLRLASSSSSDSSPSSDFSPPSNSSSSVSPPSAPNSSYVSFSDIAFGPTLDLDDADRLDSTLSIPPSSHSTTASSSATVLPFAPKSQCSPDKEATLSTRHILSANPIPEESFLGLPPSSTQLPLPSHRVPPPVIPITKATKLTPISRLKMSGAATGPAAMPAPRSNKAPFFADLSGDSLEVFLREYENLASTHSLTPRERVEQILRYVSPELSDLWQLLDGYSVKDWVTFRQSLKEIYGEASMMSRYSKQRLRDFIKLTSKSRMADEDDVRTYYKRFLVLCKPLIQHRKITEEECNAAFWGGFHPDDRRLMIPRLIASFPHHPKAQPFDYEDVFKVARAEFTNGHFTAFTLEDDWEPSFIEEPSKPDPMFQKWFNLGAPDARALDGESRGRERNRGSDSRRREDTPRREAYHASGTTGKSVRFQESSRERENQEIDDIMNQLRSLSPNEPTYASLYARCLHRYPAIAQTLQKPDYGYRSSFTINAPAHNPPRQTWNERPTPPSLPSDPSSKAAFFRRDTTEGCAFCLNPAHRVRRCPVAEEYFDSGRIKIINERIYLPNGQPVPNDRSNRGLQHAIDTWLTQQPSTTTRDPPPHTSFAIQTYAAHPQSIARAHIVEIPDLDSGISDSESEEDGLDIFGVFAAEKKKKQAKASKLPELVAPKRVTRSSTTPASTDTTSPASLPPHAIITPTPPTALTFPDFTPSVTPSPLLVPIQKARSTATPALSPSTTRPTPQYRYQATIEDQQLTTELTTWLMNGKLALTTPAHILAASPTIRKELSEKLRPRRVETNSIEEVSTLAIPFSVMEVATQRVPEYSLPLREVDVMINHTILEAGVLDQGSQIVLIRKDLAQEAGVHINTRHQIDMEGANGTVTKTLGCAENLVMQVGDIEFEIHAHVIDHAPFRLLLGRPFHHLLLCRLEDHPDGRVDVSIRDPANPARAIHISSRARQSQVGFLRTLACAIQVPPPRADAICVHHTIPNPITSSEPPALVLAAYKKVARKVKPVPASLPEDFRTLRRIPSDPLLSLPPLPVHPPNFTPGSRLTQERLDDLQLNRYNFLWPEELKLLQHILLLNESGLAWTEAEKGRFRDDYFSPVKIPIIEHVPWAQRNIPIPPGIQDEVIQIFKDKFAAGVYEHSDASYRSRWFCVKKKSGALRLVHDLQPLNAVTIRNSGVPPLAEQLIEAMAGRACYSMLDLFVGYDHRTLDISSRDLTTIQSPIGAVRLTCLPQGWTNAIAIFHEDVRFILEPEIPDKAWPFLDDCSIKGPPSRYETQDGGYETHPDNDGIRKFIWEHLCDVHRILHRLRRAGATVSAKKLFIAVPEVVILGHKCNYEGRVPDESKIAKIRDWPPCNSLSDVRAFLGITGYMRVWIRNYSSIARPLVSLTRKGRPFVWEEEHVHAMQALKNAITNSSALITIDYTSNQKVYLAVDSSFRGVGWILSQDCADGKRRPARFGSISWNEREARYSQAKIELYGLFRALRALRLHLVGVQTLVVEMDAQFVKGMLANPDIQPNAAINRWIAAILLFDFTLVHVPADKHQGPDGLSRREPVEGEDDEEDDPEEWIDNTLSLGVWTATWANKLRALGNPPSLTLTIEAHSLPSTPLTFSTSDLSSRAELDLLKIRQYLSTLKRPADLSGNDLEKFVNRARRFVMIDGRLWRRSDKGCHQLIIFPSQRLSLVRAAHDDLGHKGVYSTRRFLLDRFWWPSLDSDVKWFVETCHECQLRQETKVRIPPTVATPAPLFRKAYIDTMHMPSAGGFHYIVQARCSLTAWPEWRALRTETGHTLGNFIFEDILCRWGAVEEIVTDNGSAFVAALDWLARKYGIRHIRISAYNSRANGIVERQHRTIRESLVKTCEGNVSKWPALVPHVFWADRATTRKSTGYSPFFMAHGIEPLLPFDITLATFLIPNLTKPLSTSELIAIRARQLQAREQDLDIIRDNIVKSRLTSARDFERRYARTIKDPSFNPGDLVLVRNSAVESDHSRKTKPRYFGPMVVLTQSRNKSYRLAELDGAVSKLRYAAFRLLPYHSRSPAFIDIKELLSPEDLLLLKTSHVDVEEVAEEDA